MHLKNSFFIKSSIFLLVPEESPEGPLEVPGLGPLEDLQGTSLGRRFPARSFSIYTRITTFIEYYVCMRSFMLSIRQKNPKF